MSTSNPPTAEQELNAELADLGRSLVGAIGGVLADLSAEPLRPLSLARRLGLKKDVTHRVMRALDSADPIEALHLMPGPEALRRMLEASREHMTNPSVLDPAFENVQRLEHLIRTVAGTRGRFDCLLTAWLPEARERVDLLSRQSVYRGMSGIKGVAADTKLSAAVLTPNADGEHVDLLWLIGAFGLRRLRPGVHVRFTTKHINAPTQLVTPKINQEPEFARFQPTDFLEQPIGILTEQHHANASHFLLEGDSIGDAASVSVITAELGRACMHRFEIDPDEHHFRGPIAEVNLPIVALVFDVLVHHDIYPGSHPRVIMYDTASRGIGSANDRTRDVDRIHHTEHFDEIDGEISRSRLSCFPRYPELLEESIHCLGYSPHEFRHLRCRIDYPVYGAAIHACFKAPRDGHSRHDP